MSHDKSDEIIEPIAITFASEVLQMVELDHDELDHSLMKVSEKLQDMQITNRWQQKITDYFFR